MVHADVCTMPSMARQDQVYVGNLDVGGQQVYGEVYVQGSAATVFERPANVVNITLRDVSLRMEDSKLVIEGTNVADDEPVKVTALTPEQALGVWANCTVVWPDGSTWAKATVNRTNYKVVVKLRGNSLEFAGATVSMSGSSGTVQVAQGDNFTFTVVRPAGCVPCGANR